MRLLGASAPLLPSADAGMIWGKMTPAGRELAQALALKPRAKVLLAKAIGARA